MGKRLISTKYRVVLSILFFVIFGITFTLADSDVEQDEILRLRNEGTILPLETILEKVNTQYSGKVLEAELEEKHGHYFYEIEILAEDGIVRELKYDATTASLLSTEKDDD